MRTIFKLLFKPSTILIPGKDIVPSSKRRGVAYNSMWGIWTQIHWRNETKLEH